MAAPENEPKEPERVQLRAQPIIGEAAIATARLQVLLADGVEVEPAKNRKYLRLRNADYVCYTSVFLVVDGERHEITVDSLPDDGESDRTPSQ